MADTEEEIVIIAEDEAAQGVDSELEPQDDSEDSQKKKKLLLIGAAIGVGFLLLVIILILALKPSNKKTLSYNIEDFEEKLEKKKVEVVEPSKIENMIAKANYLYSNGSKQEALFLYEKIAVFSEAISQYNLGVAQLKNKQYSLARKTFQNAIDNNEKICVSAINAAVCSLHLKDEESFKYYIDLAHAYLHKELESPLYSYYYTLINYYRHNYLEALSSLKHPSAKNYPAVQKHLNAKINAFFDNNYAAIESMEQDKQDSESLSLALLYARVGDITLAQEHLENAILKNVQPVKAQLALGLIKLKSGQIADGAKEIQNVTDMFPEEVYSHFPIKVTLKDKLFNSKKAQKDYRDKAVNSKSLNYQKLFYFSPYKMFNANQTITDIQKGNANIFIDNTNSAKDYLTKSSSSSSVNIGITKAITKALSFKIREANNELQALAEIQPKHSILQYNLGLTYAQMGEMKEAHKHFLKSYYLDAKNYLSGIYALMASQLIDKENLKFKSIIKDSIFKEDPDEMTQVYKILLSIASNNMVDGINWLDRKYDDQPLYLAMDIMIALNFNKMEHAKRSAKKLTTALPKDILPHLLYIDTHFDELSSDKYARKVREYLKKQKFHFQDLYFGHYITRVLYTKQNLVTGRLFYLREHLKSVMASTKEPLHDLTSTLAYASLLDKKFEESYSLYNQLVDNLKVRDANTLFLGAVASISASHHENAIALLELSKIKDKSFTESRYALGLLYLEAKNNEGAAVQLSKVGNNGFVSEYFNFQIDTDHLLLKRRLKEKKMQNSTKKNNQ